MAIARVWIGLLVLSTVVGAAVSLLVALNTPPSYVGKVTMVVSPRTTVADLTIDDVDTARALTATLAEVATTAPVLEAAIIASGSNIDLQALSDSVDTNVPGGTSVIDISVTVRDPAAAVALANGIAAALVQFSKDDSQQTSARNYVLSVVDRAGRPSQAPSLGKVAQVALGGAVGLLVSISLALVVENRGRPSQRRTRQTTSPDLSGAVGPH